MDDSNPAIGLCWRCRHCQRVRSGRGSVFFLCGQAQSNPAYSRYPRLPVVECAGFDLAGRATVGEEETSG